MITLIPIGEIEESALEALKQPLAEVFGQQTQIGSGLELSRESYNLQRRQYLATAILNLIPLPPADDRMLGIVDADLFAPGLNFVFGQADVAGKRALISLKRLRQEFYGLPPDEKLFLERTLKEAVHELGHTYGLGHCSDHKCVMYFSNSLHDTDVKGWSFCSRCRTEVR